MESKGHQLFDLKKVKFVKEDVEKVRVFSVVGKVMGKKHQTAKQIEVFFFLETWDFHPFS